MRKTKIADNGGELQSGLFLPHSDWESPLVSDLPSWAGAKRIALDCETRDNQLKELGPGPRRCGYTTGWAFAIEGGSKHYLPIRHEGGDNLPEQEVLRYLRDNIANFRGDIVGANLSYDIDYAKKDGITFHPDAKFRDIQIADPIINELHFSYSLKNIGDRWSVQGKDKSLLCDAAIAMGVDPAKGMWRLPARFVGAYAENDVSAPLEIYAKQRDVLDKLDLWQVFNLETDVLPVLVRMRQRGVKIDFDKLDSIEKQALLEEKKALDFIKDKTDVTIDVGNVWKSSILAPALHALGIKLAKTSTGAHQIDANFLVGLNHPVATAILNARKANKIRTTFASSIRRYSVNERIHCSFNQIARETEAGSQKGVRFGRLSCTDPNLQQQYSPDRVGPNDLHLISQWRNIFIPEDGCLWGVNDYSQQEPRWTTHFAAVLGLPKGGEAAKRYRDDPTTDNHDMMTRLIHGDQQVDEWLATNISTYKKNRGYAKNVFLGKCYGEGDAALCRDLGLPTCWAHVNGRSITYYNTQEDACYEQTLYGSGYVREAAGKKGQEIINGFDNEVPFVKLLAYKAKQRAEKVGYVKTIMGRHLHFPKNEEGRYIFTHKALNRIIQGSSADQTKKALVDLDKAGHFIQLQVHDEIDGSFETEDEAKEVGRIMRESILEVASPLVPFCVDTEVGPSWGEIKGI